MERHVEIVTPEGVMNTYVAAPDGPGRWPVVLFYMDAPGKREELHAMARRLAAAGYFVVLPNLYYRTTREFTLVRDEAGMARMFALMATLNNAGAVRDTAALLQFVEAQPEADGSRVGAVGYCMSGPFVMAAAAAFPDRIAAIASIHGANMVTDREDSPHLLTPRIRCETYIACAEIDKWAEPKDMALLQEALDRAGTPYRLEWYPGAQHGFVFPGRGAIYDAEQAERHWSRLFDLFSRRLAVRQAS